MEVMVAMVIGMISMLVVLQVFSASEGIKRTTTGGDDAQMTGAIGLSQLERDLSQAGFGLSTPNLVGCTVTLPTGKSVPLVPVTINPATTLLPAGDNNTDTLLIVYGNPVGPAEGDLITAPPVPQTVYTMQSQLGYNNNDYVIAAPAAPGACAGLFLDKIIAQPAGPGTTVTVNTGVAGANQYILYNLGQAPVVVGYAVRGGNLTTCNYMNAATDCTSATTSGNWVEVAGNISSLRALYGHAATHTIVNAWDQTSPVSACGWLRTDAISVAMVARNTEFSTSTLTPTAPVWAEPAWSGTTVTWGGTTVTSIPIDLSANVGLASGSTWKNYRYKFYSTVALLHSVTWAELAAEQENPGCP